MLVLVLKSLLLLTFFLYYVKMCVFCVCFCFSKDSIKSIFCCLVSAECQTYPYSLLFKKNEFYINGTLSVLFNINYLD